MTYGPFDLIGVHVNSSGSVLQILKTWKPPVIVSLDHSDSWKEVKEASPDTIFVGRVVRAPGREYDPNNAAADPVAAALDEYNQVVSLADRMAGVYDYWQGINEPVIGSIDAMKRYSDFEASRVDFMSHQGHKCVIGAFSVGTPHIAYWQYFLPTMRNALANGGILGLHEYGWPALYTSWEWLLLRHKKVYDGNSDGIPEDMWDGLPQDLKKMPLVILEAGLDALIEGGEPGGWRKVYQSDPAKFLWQLDGYNNTLRQDNYVLGAALYCVHCGGDWGTYDMYPEIIDEIAKVAVPTYRRSTPVIPVPGVSENKQITVSINFDGAKVVSVDTKDNAITIKVGL